MLQFVCSNTKRPMVQKGRRQYMAGASQWASDPYHAKGDNGLTICGRKCSDWLLIDDITLTASKALKDHNLCRRCFGKLCANIGVVWNERKQIWLSPDGGDGYEEEQVMEMARSLDQP